ncbi:MAG: 4-hydroxybenzoate polyprenyltransferase/phosphoserine phosphatase [Paracoccaceae bacterium]|jgi:4-hydroxybenzoate polyprenyltransferase/phosphoserine phosphatase
MLVVDLDYSLIRTDLLHEALFEGLAHAPRQTLQALLRLREGPATFKAAMTELVRVPPEDLPYNEDVLALIRARRTAGEQVALVSGTDQRMVRVIAAYLGLFDEAFGSTPERNLTGENKAGFLAERYGAGTFDYVGDNRADVAVWKVSRRAITVGADASMRAAAQAATKGTPAMHLSPRPGWSDWWGAVLSAIRPQQWLKNILVFLPLLASQQTLLHVWVDGFIAFVAFCLIASSVYLLNDLLDLTADRAHPRKRLRSMASGRLRVLHGALLAPALVVAGTALSVAFLPLSFLAVLGLYYVATLAYSFVLKRKLVIDICTLAGLYALRVLAGGEATLTYISPWTLAFAAFLFLSLAAIKRQAELVDGLRRGKDRASGRAYEVDDLPIVAMMAIASGYVSVLVLALYSSSPEVQGLYTSPTMLWAACPVLLYWISRMVMLAHRGRMTDDPLVFAMRDPISLFSASAILAIGSAGNWF